MEIGALFTNIPENMKHRKQEKKHLRKLATHTGGKSLIIKVTALPIPLGVYQLTSSHCGQNSKEIQRRSNTFQRHSPFSAPPGFYIFSDRMWRHIASSRMFAITPFLV
ncbi:hypothetical protein AVEN_96403-1 [Araneus ventricosus]|uniref:Uncharacterized protein n=1 Tax=Araneus ventricosus TaxID=182803 RepID=A0A4Y2PSK8_ARAVE|nr:hypothetical protein AVEN_96403-1 [Araneus ventricosus]